MHARTRKTHGYTYIKACKHTLQCVACTPACVHPSSHAHVQAYLKHCFHTDIACMCVCVCCARVCFVSLHLHIRNGCEHPYIHAYITSTYVCMHAYIPVSKFKYTYSRFYLICRTDGRACAASLCPGHGLPRLCQASKAAPSTARLAGLTVIPLWLGQTCNSVKQSFWFSVESTSDATSRVW